MTPEPAGCALCGTDRDPAELAWAREQDGDGRVTWFCPPCVRRQLRDIEAKLPREWWL